MKTAIYPGSFNPWHEGHTDILNKAFEVFDKIIVARGINHEKPPPEFTKEDLVNAILLDAGVDEGFIEIVSFDGLLVDFTNEVEADAIIRGLRNGHDLQYEMNQQYWNEDLGLEIPIVYFICDRSLSHISSSTVRAVQKLRPELAQ